MGLPFISFFYIFPKNYMTPDSRRFHSNLFIIVIIIIIIIIMKYK